jgi:uncharacterized protein (TIGR02217 family)
MSNAVFPALTGLVFPVEKTPTWSTKVQTAASGKETRLSFWSYPIWQYSIGYDVLRSDAVNLELQTLLGFFNARQGAYDDWLFNDPDDNSCTANFFATGDGTTTAFQLARTWGGVLEPVRAVNAITQVTKAGSPTTAYTLNSNTGVITFNTAPGAGQALAWSGTFYWRCRFMDDQVTASKFMKNLWETQTLKFQSVK